MARLVVATVTKKDTRYKEIRLCAQNILTALDSTIDTIGRPNVIFTKKNRIFTLTSDCCISTPVLKLIMTIFVVHKICHLDETIPDLIQQPKLSGIGSAHNRATNLTLQNYNLGTVCPIEEKIQKVPYNNECTHESSRLNNHMHKHKLRTSRSNFTVEHGSTPGAEDGWKIHIHRIKS